MSKLGCLNGESGRETATFGSEYTSLLCLCDFGPALDRILVWESVW